MGAVNTEVLEQLKDIMEEDFTLLIDTFVSDTQQRLIVMEIAIGQGDGPGLRSNAHSIKGSSSNLGAEAMSASCAKLEKAADLWQPTQLQELLEQLQADFQLLCKLLKNYI